MRRFPSLGTDAFVVIGPKGLKLVLSLVSYFRPGQPLSEALESEAPGVALIELTVAVFLVPWAMSLLFNVPRQQPRRRGPAGERGSAAAGVAAKNGALGPQPARGNLPENQYFWL